MFITMSGLYSSMSAHSSSTLSASTLAVRILVAVVPSSFSLIASHLLLVRDAIIISSKTSLFWQHLWITTPATPPQPMINALPIVNSSSFFNCIYNLDLLNGLYLLNCRLRSERNCAGSSLFSAPAERGTRTAADGFAPNGRQPVSLHRLSGVLELPQAGSPLTGGRFSLNLSGECAYPAGAQEGRHLRFPPSCESPLSLGDIPAQISYM